MTDTLDSQPQLTALIEKNVNDTLNMPIIPAIGIIYPPPEIRNIIDKTAEFVAKNGMEFEEKIKTRENQNNKFNFLNRNDPYFMYYKHVLSDFQVNPNKDKTSIKPAVPAWSSSSVDTKPLASQLLNKAATFKKRRTIVDLSEPTGPSSTSPTFEFFIETPILAPVDHDTVKITAQFVSKNGRNFLQSLLQREMKNYLFDFLKPQHNLYGYFTKLTEQYTKILAPSNDMIKMLTDESKNVTAVLEKVRSRYEWIRYNDKERRKEVDEVEKEKNAFSQIDWHEFVIVEVIGFREDERTNLPPPVTLEQLGARVIAQERYEKLQNSGEQIASTENNMEKELLEDATGKPIVPVTEAIPANAPVLKDYNPKQNASENKPIIAQTKPKVPEKYMVSPITGEMIPADQMEQHLKIALLDPRWKEQKLKSAEEKRQQDLIFSTGTSIGTHLKNLAQRRSDIFGPGHEETMIGKKLDEKDDPNVKRAAPVHWESTTNSVQMAYRMGPTPATLDKQLETLQSRAMAASADTLPTVSPTPAMYRPPVNLPVSQMHQPIVQPMYLPQMGLPMGPPQQGYPPQQIPPGMPAQNYYGGPPQGIGYYDNDPALCRMRSDEELIPEDQFIAAYGNTPVNIQVRIPDIPDLVKKNNWQLQGQIEHLTINITDTITVLKNQLQKSIGLPPAKQKIIVGMARVAKDSSTMAFYNLNSSSLITLQLKERSRKK